MVQAALQRMATSLLKWVVYTMLFWVAVTTAVHPASQAQNLIQSDRQPDTSDHSPSYQPALIGTATTTLFRYASEVGLQLIHDKFSSLHLPNTHTSWNIPVVGTLNLDLSNTILHSLDIASTNTGVKPNSQGGVTFSAAGLKTYATCHFHYYKTSFPKVSGSGQADVRFEDGSVQYKLIPQADGAGHAMIISQEPAEVCFGAISVHTSHTPAAWLYNLILDAFHGPFKDAITAEVSRQVTATLPTEVNKLLAGVPTIVELDRFQLNTSLAGNPIVEPDRITVKDWGRFRLPSQECPYQRATSWSAPADTDDKTPMLIGDIDESIVNCLTWVLQERKVLQKRFTSSEVPIALQTDNWAGVVPNLPAQYPGKNMTLDVATAEPLLTHITPENGIIVSGNATLLFSLDSDEPELTNKPLFALGIASDIRAKRVWVESGQPDCDWRLMIELEIVTDSIRVETLSSYIGPVKADALQSSIRWLASSIAQKWINGQLLKKGFALPDVPYVQIQQPTISFKSGYISVAADVKYVA
ncbi:hypothetical protein ABBQ38_005974 [Trebouxia sp. C0009 RCD-2024]